MEKKSLMDELKAIGAIGDNGSRTESRAMEAAPKSLSEKVVRLSEICLCAFEALDTLKKTVQDLETSMDEAKEMMVSLSEACECGETEAESETETDPEEESDGEEVPEEV